MKRSQLVIASLALLLAVASSVQAANVNSQLFVGNRNQLSDNSAEYLSVDLNANGILEVGDSIRGIIDINTVENLDVASPTNFLGGGSGNNELAGVFEITCIDSVPVGMGLNFVTFAPSAAFQTQYGAGAMVALYEDPVVQFTRSGAAIPVLEANVTNGVLYQVFGFSAAPGTTIGWTALAPTNLVAAGATPPGVNAGMVNFALNLLANPGGLPLGLVANGFGGVSNLAGSGNILGTGGVPTPYMVYDNFDAVIQPVPVPASMLLLGSGLIGLVGFRRKARK